MSSPVNRDINSSVSLQVVGGGRPGGELVECSIFGGSTGIRLPQLNSTVGQESRVGPGPQPLQFGDKANDPDNPSQRFCMHGQTLASSPH